VTAPGATNPIATPAGFVPVSGPSFQEADGHMIWSAGFAKGDGQISYDPDYSQSSDQGTTASIFGGGTSLSCMGNTVFGGMKANVVCTGGPVDPCGNTYTLDATLEPAYTDTAGTTVYRKTLVTATIPAQVALPV
jgi:hypothetical protein